MAIIDILLSQSKEFACKAFIDDNVLDSVNKYAPWVINKPTAYPYSSKTLVSLHKQVLLCNGIEVPDGMVVDHINRNRFDNRLDNLRLCTTKQNMANQGVKRSNTTGYKGVSKFREQYSAKIRINGEMTHLGLYDTPEDAALAYDYAARREFGEDYAYCNFEASDKRMDCKRAKRTNGNVRPNISRYTTCDGWRYRVRMGGVSFGTFKTREEAEKRGEQILQEYLRRAGKKK